MTMRDIASLIGLLIVLTLILQALLSFFAPSLLDWLNEKAPYFPESGQPVRVWRGLNRIWLVAASLLGVAALMDGDLGLAVLCAAGALYFGYSGFEPAAARKHAAQLHKLARGRCPWCGFFYGRERPEACPSCEAQQGETA